jgi:hypothetical protein
MLHYHGTPISPRAELETMAGRSFCVSFADARDAQWCLDNAQSVMWDNGAFSVWKSGKTFEPDKFSRWVADKLGHPHWAVVPDVIGGTPEENLELIRQWPHDKSMSAVVWHLNEPIDHLLRLADLGFGKLCFGSTEMYDPVGSKQWARRADEAFDALSKRGTLPWVHALRGLSLAGRHWPFASADSTNVARNFKNRGNEKCPNCMAERIDAKQTPMHWF